MAGSSLSVRMSGTGARRLRSRTPPTMRRSTSSPARREECCICWDNIGSDKQWKCLQCNVAAHVRCMSMRNGSIHLPNGCPQCRVTMRQLIAQVKRPGPASKGIVCYACRGIIEEGRLCQRCAAPRYYCQAHWHIECVDDQLRHHIGHRCPACNQNAYQALCVRRS